MPIHLGLVALIASLSTNPAAGAGQAPAPQPCTGLEFRQFDFWIGEWTVTDATSGKEAGRNTISREYGGCVLVERWRGTRGMTGSSFNVFVPEEKKWVQIWVDSTGLLLRLSGDLRDGSMRMEGEGLGAGQRTLNRITWTPRPDGTVRQLWEISTGARRQWTVAFDGLYRRTEGPEEDKSQIR